jgi:hypothetical protein
MLARHCTVLRSRWCTSGVLAALVVAEPSALFAVAVKLSAAALLAEHAVLADFVLTAHVFRAKKIQITCRNARLKSDYSPAVWQLATTDPVAALTLKLALLLQVSPSC